ncbi:MAG: hypothetical protein RXQ62_01305 [Nitrososphaeria archaeon]
MLPLSGYLSRTGAMNTIAAFLAAPAGFLVRSYFDYYVGRAFGVRCSGGSRG